MINNFEFIKKLREILDDAENFHAMPKYISEEPTDMTERINFLQTQNTNFYRENQQYKKIIDDVCAILRAPETDANTPIDIVKAIRSLFSDIDRAHRVIGILEAKLSGITAKLDKAWEGLKAAYYEGYDRAANHCSAGWDSSKTKAFLESNTKSLIDNVQKEGHE